MNEDISAIERRIALDLLSIEAEGEAGLRRWARRFELAWFEGRVEECARMIASVKSSGIALSPLGQAIVLRCQGLLALQREEYDRAERDFRASLTLADAASDHLLAGRLLNDLGTLDQARGDLPSAIGHYRAALDRLPPANGGPDDAPMVRNNLGLALISAGEWAAGVAELERARDIYERLGYPQGVARAQINLGQVYAQQGEHDAATAAFEDALTTLRRFDETRLIGETLNSLGVLAKTQGKFEQAATYYTESLALAQETRDFGGQAQAYGNLGALYHQQGLSERAASCYREALAHYEQLGDTRGQALMWGNLGGLEGLEGRAEASVASHERSIALCEQAGARADAARARINLAGALRDLRRLDEAESLYFAALEASRQLDDLRGQERGLGGLAILRSAQGRYDEARALLDETFSLQRRRRDIPAQIETLYKFGVVARDEGRKEAELAEILRPAWDLAQEHDAGRWLVAIAWLLGDAALEEEQLQAYNYYATAAAIARQHGDERRYRRSIDTIQRNIQELDDHGRFDDAEFARRYVLEFWEQVGLAEWVPDGIAELRQAEARRAHA